MLVLSRRPGETVTLTAPGWEGEITICRAVGGRVKIGFTLPKEIRVQRAELGDRDRDTTEDRQP